jgi:hypothetical protein
MMKIGPYIIMKAANHPAFLKAEKLARCLSYNDIEEILAGKRHVHRNPIKRKTWIPSADGLKTLQDAGLYPKAGE